MKTKTNALLTNVSVYLLGMGVLAGAASAVPLSDMFAARPIATGSLASFSGDNTGATWEAESGEPDHGGVRHRSLWCAWTAPSQGNVTIDTVGSAIDTVLAVYTGTVLSNLCPVAQNDNIPSSALSRVSFPTKAGQTYAIAVDGHTSTSVGFVSVNLAFTAVDQPDSEVGTDGFAAQPLLTPGLAALGVCNNRQFTAEAFEPSWASVRRHTAWWRWVASTNGLVTIDTLASDFDTYLNVFVGPTITNLTCVARSDDVPNVNQSSVSFQVRAGQEYHIMVDGETSTSEGNVILRVAVQPNFEPGAVVGSDAFAGRGLLGGVNALGVACNIYSGVEAFEPSFGSIRKKTMWWQWTAPADGPVRIRTEGSDFATFLGVYTGYGVSGLTLVTNNIHAPGVTWSDVHFTARRGLDYQVMVDGYSSVDQGDIVLHVDQAASPLNTLAQYAAVELEMPGTAGTLYQLQCSSDLVTWQNFGAPVMGNGTPVRVLDSTRGVGKRFYRYLTRP